MKKTIARAALIGSLAFLLTACGGPTIDGKNNASFQKSVEAIMAELPAKEGAEFRRNLSTISMHYLSNATQAKSLSSISDSMEAANIKMLEVMDGKTVKEIAKEAERIRKEG